MDPIKPGKLPPREGTRRLGHRWASGRAGFAGSAGVVIGEEPTAVLDQVVALLGTHRVWERFPVSIS